MPNGIETQTPQTYKEYNVKITSQFKTKLDKDDKVGKVTVVTYNFPATMPQVLVPGWIDSANIRLQAKFRRDKKVPQTLQVDALEFASSSGSRSQPVTKESVTAMMSTFTPAQLEQMIKEAHKKEVEEKKAANKAANNKNKPHPQAKPSGTPVTPGPVKPDGGKDEQPYVDTP